MHPPAGGCLIACMALPCPHVLQVTWHAVGQPSAGRLHSTPRPAHLPLSRLPCRLATLRCGMLLLVPQAGGSVPVSWLLCRRLRGKAVHMAWGPHKVQEVAAGSRAFGRVAGALLA